MLQERLDGISEILSSNPKGNTDNRIVMQMTRTAVIIVCILTNLREATSPTATSSSSLSDHFRLRFGLGPRRWSELPDLGDFGCFWQTREQISSDIRMD